MAEANQNDKIRAIVDTYGYAEAGRRLDTSPQSLSNVYRRGISNVNVGPNRTKVNRVYGRMPLLKYGNPDLKRRPGTRRNARILGMDGAKAYLGDVGLYSEDGGFHLEVYIEQERGSDFADIWIGDTV